jgi:uncharacterized protein YkwD
MAQIAPRSPIGRISARRFVGRGRPDKINVRPPNSAAAMRAKGPGAPDAAQYTRAEATRSGVLSRCLWCAAGPDPSLSVFASLISALSGGDEFCSIAGEKWGGGAMKMVWLAIVIASTSTLAHAEDMAEMISRYRREQGLSAVKTDPQLTAIAERQAKAMAASGVMDHSVAGSLASRISGAPTGRAAENIAAGTKTWAETLRVWQNSPGHNANLLQPNADSVGVAVARNDQTRYKTFWAMVIAQKLPTRKDHKVAVQGRILERRESLGTSQNQRP